MNTMGEGMTLVGGLTDCWGVKALIMFLSPVAVDDCLQVESVIYCVKCGKYHNERDRAEVAVPISLSLVAIRQAWRGCGVEGRDLAWVQH